MYKVLCLSPLPEGLLTLLFSEYLEKYNLQVSFVTVQSDASKEEIMHHVSDSDIIIGDYTMRIHITRDVVEKMGKVKLIAQPSTGYDHIDVSACKEKGIPVSNVGGANSVSVAEHTICLALALTRRIFTAHNSLISGRWIQDDLMNTTYELQGKTWGVIGLGRIGVEVSKRANMLGMKVIYYDARRQRDEDERRLNVSFQELRSLLSNSDIVSVHVPLNESTRNMIDERELRIMKPTSLIINVARGGIINENALYKALTEGWISGAGIDVFSDEPPRENNPLIAAAKEGANIILTPHIAGATYDSRLRIIQTTVQNVLRVMLGQEPENVVNK